MIAYHFYADDSQLWKKANPKCQSDVATNLKRLEIAISHISTWMRDNRLKLNSSKTEFLVIGSEKNRKKAQVDSIKVDNDRVTASESAKNLGLTLDQTLSLEKHISGVVKSCRYHLRELWHIRKYLSEDTAKIIVHALIISKLEYCNSLYVNLPDRLLAKLQSVLHDAARLITRTARSDHITPVLIHLHWLSIKERIEFKVLTIVYKTIHGESPEYLRELLTIYKPSRDLRLASHNLLHETRYRLTSAGLRCFEVAGPKL